MKHFHFIAIISMLFFFLSGTVSYAADSEHTSGGGLSLAGLWVSQSFKDGGGIEFGFPLYTGTELDCRNFIFADGYGSREFEFGGFSVGDKIRLGGRVKRGVFTIISYGYVTVEAGLVRISESNLLEPPFSMEIGGGGGFEFVFSEVSSFFIEYGGSGFFLFGDDNNSLSGDSEIGGTVLMIGYRTYF